jgi:Zn-finger nucleic acid-binding protein
MKCPVCKVPTFVVEYEKIELDQCPRCSGVWFDAGELDLLLDDDALVNLHKATTDEELRACPLCRQAMEKVNIGPADRVLIDSCPAECGLWFDNGELIDLTRSLQDKGWQMPVAAREFLCGVFNQSDTDERS